MIFRKNSDAQKRVYFDHQRAARGDRLRAHRLHHHTLTRAQYFENADKRRSINAAVDSTLARLYTSANGSRELVAKARDVLVFPSIIQAGFWIGGQCGEGACGLAVRWPATTAPRAVRLARKSAYSPKRLFSYS